MYLSLSHGLSFQKWKNLQVLSSIFNDKPKNSDHINRKLKAFSSVLYNIIMDFFKENIPIAKHNQMYISPEKRVKSIKNPLSVYTDAGHLCFCSKSLLYRWFQEAKTRDFANWSDYWTSY